MTQEDSLPLWVLRQFPQGAYTWIEDGKTSTRDRVKKFRTKRVCEDCQRWLNATFEIPAQELVQSLMEGKAQHLDGGQQTLLSKWIAKTVLMIRLHRRNRPQFLSTVYREFRHNGSVPEGMNVWVGASDVDGLGPLAGHPSTQTQPLQNLPPMDLRYWGCNDATLQVQHLVTQALLCHLRDVGSIKHNAETLGALVRIWPVTIGGVDWPPRFVMRQPDTAHLTERAFLI